MSCVWVHVLVYENVYSAFISDDRELTDALLFNLASYVTSRSGVRTLAFRELGMSFSAVDLHIMNNQSDMTAAMYDILLDWRQTQPDNRTAYINLGQALKRAGMSLLIDQVMGGWLEDFEGKFP